MPFFSDISEKIGSVLRKFPSRLKIESLFTKKRLIIILVFLLFLSILLASVAFFSLRITPSDKPKFLFSIDGRAGEMFTTPLCVAVSGGRVYVADSGHGRIEVFSTDRQFLFNFQVRITPLKEGVSPSQASYPVGITIGKFGKDERVFVSDLCNQKILVFDSNGHFLKFFYSRSLNKPLALAFFEGRLYVTDIGDHTVKIFTHGGRLLRRIGRSGSKDGKLSFPNGIFVDKSGTIFVADSNNGRVQVFSSDGKFERQFKGSLNKKLSLPRGIAIDKKNRVHVVDALGHKVFVFSRTGNLLFTYGEEGPPREQLSFPNGIAIDNSDRRIYVTDRGNNSVSVWEY